MLAWALCSGWFSFPSSLDDAMLVLVRWELVDVHLDSLLALVFPPFTFFKNMELESKPTSREMNGSVRVTLSDNFR